MRLRLLQRRTYLLAISALFSACVVSGAAPTATPTQVVETGDFQTTWARTDKPVADGEIERTWIWGPEPNTAELAEVYVDAPVGKRRVLYYDKSRMEITDPAANLDDPWRVTNGLLVVELVAGDLQVGDDTFEQYAAADVNVVGDPDGAGSPTYAELAELLGAEAGAEGATITAFIDGAGAVSDRAEMAEYGVNYGPLSDETGQRTASVFWAFMTSSGSIWNGSEVVDGELFPNPYYATGLPITEAYWTRTAVGGVDQDVLLQCFERRCLTFTPSNDAGWQVESGNVGLHYYTWRYEQLGLADPEPYPERLDALPEAVFEIGDGASESMRVEVAVTGAEKQCGLMHRLGMPENQGMLFVYSSVHDGGFWNCNTFIPLSLAWIDSDGEIVALTDMEAMTPGEPQDTRSDKPGVPYQYVIEANQGWYAEHGVEVGDRVDLSEPLEVGSTSGRPVCELLGLQCGG